MRITWDKLLSRHQTTIRLFSDVLAKTIDIYTLAETKTKNFKEKN